MTPEHKFALFTTFGPAGLSALIAAFVSWLVTRHMLKNSPDYQKQLNSLRVEMSRMTAVHQDTLDHQRQVVAGEQQRREAERWKPKARLVADPAARSNTLHIQSNRQFRIEKVDVLTASGVYVTTVPSLLARNVLSTRSSIAIPVTAIQRLIDPDPDYREYRKTTGRLRYFLEVEGGGEELSFDLQFRVMQAIDAHTVWNRMEG